MKYLFLIPFLAFAQPTKIMFDLSSDVVGYRNVDNELIDFFHNGRYVFDYADSTRTNTFIDLGIMDWQDGFAIDSSYTDATYGEAFVIKYNDGANFPEYINNYELFNYIFEFIGDYFATNAEEAVARFGFWIYRPELNGNGLIFCTSNGTPFIISNANLAIQGYRPTWIGTNGSISVYKVVGDYSYILDDLSLFSVNGRMDFRLSIYNSDADSVSQFTMFNPTVVYTTRINYYKDYESTAEKDTSTVIGDTLLLIGDSQYNDGVFQSYFADSTGMTIVDAQEGGHRMAYSATYWFYEWTKRSDVLEWDVNYYFLPISTNDQAGGDTTDASIDSVIYYYPYYGDDPDTVTAKLARFTALSTARKTSIFAFQQTYCAYIQQMKLRNPNATIIVASVPIDAGSGTMTGDTTAQGYGIWAEGYSAAERVTNRLPAHELKKIDIVEVATKNNTEYIDLMGTFTDGVNNGDGVRLDFYNILQFCYDGVHWYPEIKKRIASILKEYLK